jgi:hypothetical protein
MWKGLLKLTAYCFYLPLGVMGPLVTSSCYEASLTQRTIYFKRKETISLFLGLFRWGYPLFFYFVVLVNCTDSLQYPNKKLRHQPNFCRFLMELLEKSIV